MNKDNSAPAVFLGALFLLAIILHFVGVGQPFLGNFAQHQTDYATVSQRWADLDIELLHPVMRFMGEGKNRIFLGDLPLTMALVAYSAKLTKLPIDFLGRTVSTLFFFVSIFPLYALLKRFIPERKTVYYCLFFYLVSPLTLIYGQSYLLEVPALTFAILAYFFFFQWSDKANFTYFLLSAVCFSLMAGLRIYYLPLLMPPFLFIFYQEKWCGVLNLRFLSFILISLAVPILWQAYAYWAGSHTGQESSLRDNLRVFVKDDSELKLNFSYLSFYLPILDILIQKMITPIGFSLTLGLFLLDRERYAALIRFLVVMLLCFAPLFFLAPRKFVEFEYYYMPLVVPFAILAGIALSLIENRVSHARATLVFLSFILFLAIRYSFAPIFFPAPGFSQIKHSGLEVMRVVPAGSKIIAAHRSTPFLFYTNLDGWAFPLEDQVVMGVRLQKDYEGNAIERLERLRNSGAEYFALGNIHDRHLNPPFFNYLDAHYKIIHRSERSLVYHLVPDSPDSIESVI